MAHAFVTVFGKYLTEVEDRVDPFQRSLIHQRLEPELGNHMERYERYTFQFPNGYGASVIRHRYSYGGPQGFFELAVLKGDAICYESPLTTDVLGWQTEDEICECLEMIKNLEEQKQ